MSLELLYQFNRVYKFVTNFRLYLFHLMLAGVYRAVSSVDTQEIADLNQPFIYRASFFSFPDNQIIAADDAGLSPADWQ